MENCEICSVKPKDAKELLKIYSYYVENTAISFEYVTPSVKEFKKRIKTITKSFPYICLVKDGQIKGLENQLKSRGFRNLYAGIATPLQEDEYLDFSSHKFHEKMGFVKVAEFHGCGIKFDRVYNLIYVEKVLS